MPRRYWLSLCAVVGLALAVPVHAQPKGAGNSHQANAAQSHDQRPTKPEPALSPAIQKFIERIASALEGANRKQNPAEEPKYATDYLQSQKDMATNAGRMFWVALADTGITFIGVLLVGGTLVAAWTSAKEARRAANEAKRQADTAEGVLSKLERPHVFVEGPRLGGQTQMRLHQTNVIWPGGKPGFFVEYDVMNYGRSPPIITERSATVFIGEVLPSAPEVNPNDIYTDPVVIKGGSSRKGWQTIWRSGLTDEVIEQLRLGRGPAMDEQLTPRPFKAYLFVRLKYESVYGKTDEVGAIWKYLIDINAFNPVQIENYTYRKLGP